ncbi:hypothetical protein FOBRF1_013388 [Fusarium oxysporum]
MTDFLQLHPGGANAILTKAGKDVSRLFTSLHPPTALNTLPVEYCLGPVDAATLPIEKEEEMTEDDIKRLEARESMPHVNDMLLVEDFEHWAKQVLSNVAWAYYRSASDYEVSFHENSDALTRYFFRPRILRGTLRGDTTTNILGVPASMPVMISPAAMAKLGHPLGEVNLTKAAGSERIIQIISTDASCSLEEIFEARKGDQPLFYQVYLNKDRKLSEDKIRMADRLGAKAIVLTVDVMRQSKRTLDVREKQLANPTPKDFDASKSVSSSRPQGISESIAGSHDFNLSWKDVDFIRENTKLPIILKGVQCVEDVQLCVDHGVQGVILSNHGGRQADCVPAPIDVLYELRVLRPDLFDKIEIMVDGGFRSGADVVKALALGAKAVGMGRPFLYANGTHEADGLHFRLTLRVAIEQLSTRIEQLHSYITDNGLVPPPMDKEDHQLLLRVLEYQRIPYATLSRDLRPSQGTRKTSVQKQAGPQPTSSSPPVSTSDQDTAPQQHDHADAIPVFGVVENEPNISAYPPTSIQVPQPWYQESCGTSDGNPPDLTIPQYANDDSRGIQPTDKEELHEFSSPYTENKSTGQTDETEALIDQLSDRFGTLQVGAGGHIRYYGPTSNFNLAPLPFPDVFSVGRTVRNDGNELLDRLGLNKPIPAALEEHLTKLYFTWQDPMLHVVNQYMFYLAKSQWEDGEESPYYSESLQNALSLAEFFADRAKSLLEIELDNPCVATIQTLAVLSSHDISYKRDSRGWLYSGMALRLAFDLGLHVDTTSHVSQGLLSQAEAGLRQEVFWGTYITDTSWGFYLGQPFRMHTEDITVAKPKAGAYPGNSSQWFSYGIPHSIHAGARLSDSLGQLHQEQVSMAGIMAPVANVLYGDFKIPCGVMQEVNANTVATLLAWKDNLPPSLVVDLDDQQTKYLPHVLLLHMQYHQNIIHAHRPYMSRTYLQPFPPKGPGSDHARMMCMYAAISVAKLLQIYEINYDLRKINIQAVGITCSAALLLIFAMITHYQPDEGQTKRYLTTCFRALDEASSSWDTAKRARELLLLIQRQWELKGRSARSDLELASRKRRRPSDLDTSDSAGFDSSILEDLIDINMGLDLGWIMSFPMGPSQG